ncbi:NADP-dependent oxidoreductase [Oceanicola sp. 22II-s10i]|uniref:NADP-dependent oxidoreductase n=1 Tax=Oceanicola sp. 22II-s10i TaxID=1317116 RepID=UPI000B524981|nr:NADP-dependent oxidoreductase [Oceanicola sp. 22II-s10i]OWU84504.1 NADP-dependent oxidoreductase [Oceanicola sp. 22II-s10i]
MRNSPRRIVLARRPDVREPRDEFFRIEDIDIPTPAEGEVLIAVRYMSLDPYIRARMDDIKGYTSPTAIGDTMEAGAVGEVIESRSPDFKPGDYAQGLLGWTTHACLPAEKLRKVDPDELPISTSLGVLGMPGFTAWAGITAYGELKPGETLVVAAATGPVGSMVGQLAKAAGCRVIGVAGGPEKCRIAVETFGFDACIDHRENPTAEDMEKSLAALCPDGIDVYFDNVGGPILGGAMRLLNIKARIIICGMITWKDGAPDPTGDSKLRDLWRLAVVKRVKFYGLLQTDHAHRMPEFLAEIAPRVKSGEIVYLEDVAEGLEAAPGALRSLIRGGNLGKQVVRIS